MRRTTRRRAVGLLVAMMGLVVALAAPAWAQAPAAQTAGGKTTTTWYFYKVKWGFQDEFMTLFQKNHYPLLKAGVTDGRFVSVKTYVPRYHGDGRADWTFAVEIVAKDDAPSGPSEDEVIKKLFPDQATYKKEEQRRFEILDAHWDVPLNGVDLDARK
jgi:hypothetical protein